MLHLKVCPCDKENKVFSLQLNVSFCFFFAFFLEINNSEGTTVAKASGLRPAAVFGSLMVQLCLLKAWHKIPALNQFLCLRRFKDYP